MFLDVNNIAHIVVGSFELYIFLYFLIFLLHFIIYAIFVFGDFTHCSYRFTFMIYQACTRASTWKVL